MSSAPTLPTIARFDPKSFKTFRFAGRSLNGDGEVRLRYELDDLEFEEKFVIPRGGSQTAGPNTVEALLDLLHWVAGVSYYKAAIPETISFGGTQPGPATTKLLTALYAEGLGEFAVVNALPALPSPDFQQAIGPAAVDGTIQRRHLGQSEVDASTPARHGITNLLVPVGGGKDSAVAIEIARASGLDVTLFSVGDALPIRETARVSGYERLTATRTTQPVRSTAMSRSRRSLAARRCSPPR
jgi:hypothetical protein